MATPKKSSRVKIVSMGNPETGKSCIIKRYCEKRFVAKYMATIGIDFGVTKVSVDDMELKVNIFDLSGHPVYYEVRNEFYKDTQGVLLAYDVTERDSFDSLDYWIEELKHNLPQGQEFDSIVVIVCANKVDKKPRVIKEETGRKWCQKYGCHYFEMSALTGDGVTAAFQMIFKSLVQVLETGVKPQTTYTTLGYTPEQEEVIRKLKNSKSNYERLGLTANCSREDVNKAYKRLARLLHPDKSVAPETEAAFKILNQARIDILQGLGK